MPAKLEPLDSKKVEIHKRWIRKILGESAGTLLIDLGITMIGMECGPVLPGLCSRCQSERDPQSSTAEYPNVFCSKECEQEFVRTALSSLTLDDCIQIHGQLETLLLSAQGPAL